LIRRAQDEGAFDGLPGAGKPLPGVDALNAEIAKANARATEGPPTRLGRLDVDAILAEWRARSA
jgi:hypothetical protein